MKSGISAQWHHPSIPQLLILRLNINRINVDSSSITSPKYICILNSGTKH